MHDLLIRHGTIYDGSGGAPISADIAIDGDTIATIGPAAGPARQTIDAAGLAVAPGFINLMCWANASLLHDGRSQSDIRQGVTLEILGEGWSMGPLNDALKTYMVERQGDIRRLDAVRQFGGVGLQELAARRRGEKELLDLDRGAGGAGGRAQLAGAAVQHRGGGGIGGA